MKIIKEELEDTLSDQDTLSDEEEEPLRIGAKNLSRSKFAKDAKETEKDIRSGGTKDITDRENAIIRDIKDALLKIAKEDDLNKHRAMLQQTLNKMLSKIS